MKESKLLTKQIPGGNGMCYLRPNRFDEEIFDTLINQQEYEYFRFLKEPAIIIDAGANIGLASVCFAIAHPHATIFAIEPEKGNFEMLKRNVSAYPNIVPLRYALMGKDGSGGVLHNDSTLGYQVSFGKAVVEAVDCVTLSTFCEKYGITHINLLKMDIEGAEKEVLKTAENWMSMVDVLVLELHERYVKDCNQTVFSALESYFQLEWIGGENFYFAKEKIAIPTIPEIFKKENPQKLPIEISWDIRDRYDQLYTDVCAEKDAVLDALGKELESNSIHFDQVCAEKDAALEALGKELESNSIHFGQVCAEKDAALNALEKELADSSERFGQVCAEKDAALNALEKELADSSERFGQVCAEKDAALNALEKELADNSECFGQVCAEKDAALDALEKELANSSELFGRICTEKDNAFSVFREAKAAEIAELTEICAEREARLLEQQAKLDDYAEKYATLGRAIRTIFKGCFTRKMRSDTRRLAAHGNEKHAKKNMLPFLCLLLVCGSFWAVYFGDEARAVRREYETSYTIEVEGAKKIALPGNNLLAGFTATPLEEGYYLDCVIANPGENCDDQIIYMELTASGRNRTVYQLQPVERQDYAELMGEPAYRMAGGGITLPAEQMEAGPYSVRLFREKDSSILYTEQTWEFTVPEKS